MDQTEAADQISERLLTADELVAVRKPAEPVIQPIGEKSYFPSGTWLEDKQLRSLLEEQKALLDETRVAKLGDLMQVEWNSSLKKAIAHKLKGKFIQHMGFFENGAMTLSPEETVFLLESGHIELLHGGMPMSTEEAYAVVLNGEFALEKYQVYCYLSRLGFLLVRHQEKLDVTSYEKKLNLDQTKNKKKQRHSGSVGSRKKSLNFHGAFTKPIKEDIITPEDNIVSSINNNFAEMIDKSCEKENDNSVEPERNSENEKDIEPNGTIEENISTFPEIIISKDDTNGSTTLPVLNDDTDTVDKMQDSNDSNVEINVTDSNSPTKHFDENSASEKRVEVEADNNTDEINVDSADDSLNTCVAQGKEVDLVVPSNQAKNLNADQESDNSSDVLCIDESMDSDSSKSIDDQRVDQEDVSNTDSKQSSDEDDENDTCESGVVEGDDIVFVEVKKKEAKPLAVIDLGSDDEPDNESSQVGSSEKSDDDIQIIEESSTPRSVIRKRKIASWISLHADGSAKRNRTHSTNLIKKEEHNSSAPREFSGPTWMFPNVAKKNFICLARPPPHLLPVNVRLAKEAYPIDLAMLRSERPAPIRVWNSYKDIQERQRSRYSERHQEYNHHQDHSRIRPSNHTPYPPSGSRWPHSSYNSEQDHSVGNNNFPNTPEMPINPASLLNGPLGIGLGQPSIIDNLTSPYSTNDVADYFRAAHQSTMQLANNIMHSVMTHQLNSFRVFNYQSYQNPLAPLMPTNNFSPLHHNLYQMIEQAKHNSSPMQNIGQNSNMMSRREPSSNNDDHRSVHSSRFSEQGPVGEGDYASRLPHYRAEETYPMYERHQGGSLREEDNRQSFGGDQWNQNSQYDSRPNRTYDSHRFHRNNFRRQRHFNRNRSHFDQPPFPSSIPKLPVAATSWKDYKSADPVSTNEEIVEVPININEILWSKDICPLIKPGVQHPIADVLKGIQITKSANLVEGVTISERYLPTTCSLEISFDVYLPGTNYRKSCPTIPNYRIIVARSTDPFPKMSEMVVLQRKFKDTAILQFAVVDNGDIAFYSFSHTNLPTLLS